MAIRISERAAKGLRELAALWDFDSAEDALNYVVEQTVASFEEPAPARAPVPVSPAK